MTRRARIGFGSTCESLKVFLEKNGYSEISVYPALGAWRQSRFDVMSWEVHMILPEHKGKGHNYIHCFGCWESITNFLKKAKKYGFHIDDDELWANEEVLK